MIMVTLVIIIVIIIINVITSSRMTIMIATSIVFVVVDIAMWEL